MHTLLDTSRTNDALAAGYEAAEEGGLKIEFEADPAIGPCVYLSKCGHSIDLYGAAEINEVIRALQTAIKRSETECTRILSAA